MKSVAEAPALSEVELQFIDLFVSAAAIGGIPRSVGEIYGLLFTAPGPMPMDEIMARLQISLGSASQGLRFLRSLGAVKTQYVAGDRRDHFVAETELRALLSGLLREQVNPHIENGANRLGNLREALKSADPAVQGRLKSRIDKLERWHKIARNMLPVIERVARS